ncbi:hypothetical protein [Variovorax paradoxus]|uniref:hypothetical protein n=1 Tax=Variovorax paradoxus TaxID=34073 RepID=UPI001ABCB0FB
MPIQAGVPTPATRQLVKMRIMQTNALRGIMSEFGIELPVGHSQLLKAIQAELAKAQQEDRLPADLVVSVQEQLKRVDALHEDIEHSGHPERYLLAFVYGQLGEHDLLRVRADAEKFMLLAALNLVECVAYVGAQLQSK